MGNKNILSIIILTYYEEIHIEHAIRSLALLNASVLVVDSVSKDRTVDIAQALSAHAWVAAGAFVGPGVTIGEGGIFVRPSGSIQRCTTMGDSNWKSGSLSSAPGDPQRRYKPAFPRPRAELSNPQTDLKLTYTRSLR